MIEEGSHGIRIARRFDPARWAADGLGRGADVRKNLSSILLFRSPNGLVRVSSFEFETFSPVASDSRERVAAAGAIVTAARSGPGARAFVLPGPPHYHCNYLPT